MCVRRRILIDAASGTADDLLVSEVAGQVMIEGGERASAGDDRQGQYVPVVRLATRLPAQALLLFPKLGRVRGSQSSGPLQRQQQPLDNTDPRKFLPEFASRDQTWIPSSSKKPVCHRTRFREELAASVCVDDEAHG
jgi:hypothetical protein